MCSSNRREPLVLDRRALLTGATLAVALPATAEAATFPLPRGRRRTTLAADGVAIVSEEFGLRNGPTLVFVHGWMCDRSYWGPQIRRFARTHRLIAIDLAGHGESGGNRTAWAIATLADDVARVIRDAQAERVTLIGHSMGGGVVTLAAAKLTPAPLGVVTVDSSPWARRDPNRPPPPAIDVANFRASAEAMVRRSMFTPNSPPDLIERVARGMANANPERAMAVRAGYAQYDSGAAYAALAAIPLVMINAMSRNTDIDGIRAVHPDTRFWILPDVGHFVMLERPDAFNSILAAELVAFDGVARPA